MSLEDSVRCVQCRALITVAESFAQGDHVKCGSCGTGHRVVRKGGLSLVLADISSLRQTLNQQRAVESRIERELQNARAAVGVGVNGLLIGLGFLIWQLGWQQRDWSRGLLAQALVIALITGVALEAVNYLFLAKRQKIDILSAELKEARRERSILERRLREAKKTK